MLLSRLTLLWSLVPTTLLVHPGHAVKPTIVRREELHGKTFAKSALEYSSTQASSHKKAQVAHEITYEATPAGKRGVIFDMSRRLKLSLLSYFILLALFVSLNIKTKRERKQSVAEYDKFYEALSGVPGKASSCEHEDLVQEQWDGVLSYSQLSNHVIRYDEYKSISFPVLFMFKRTLLASPKVNNEVLISVVLGACFFALSYIFEDGVSAEFTVRFSVDELQTLCNFITSLVGVLLGFYISTVYGRWWALRKDTIGSLWGAVDDICCLMGAHFSGVEYQKARSLVLRYCMVSYELTFMQAAGNDGQLWRLVNRRLLTADEAEKLQPLPSKSQVMWTWIAWIFNGLHQQGVLDNVILQVFYTKSVQARGAIGQIFAYLDTQVPFIYVQLLAGIVHVLTIAIALNCGVSTARWARNSGHMEVHDDKGMMVKMIQLVVVPYFYNGCLEVARVMSNPLGDDASDFPRYSFFHFMRREAEAFHTTMEEPCAAAVEALSVVSKAQSILKDGTPPDTPTPDDDGHVADIDSDDPPWYIQSPVQRKEQGATARQTLSAHAQS